MPRWCIECNKRPASYNYPGEKTRLYCPTDKKAGMISLVIKYCVTCLELHLDKPKCASFNYPDQITVQYCGTHKLAGMINIKKLRKGALQTRNKLPDEYPHLVLEWHEDNDHGPEHYLPRSNEIIKWKCTVCEHTWAAPISNRTGKNARGCPVCAGKTISKDLGNSVKMQCPKLCKQWHSKNKQGPECYTKHSGANVWWQCPKRKCHVYKAVIDKRVRNGHGCPFCSHQRLCTTDYCNSIYFEQPKLAREYYEERNGKSAKEQIAGGNKKVWWRCLLNPEHIWYISAATRIQLGTNCPMCKRSKLELEFIDWVIEANLVYKEQVRLANFSHKKKLPYDFLIPENILIELDGRQHFDCTSYYSKLGNFKENIWKDLLKTWYAIKNEYTLIRISYLDRGKVAKLLDQFIDDLDEPKLLYPRHPKTLVEKVYNIHARITQDTTEEELAELYQDVLELIL